MKSKPFSNQVALVTGGGTGIGRALSAALAHAGATVIISSRREEVLQRTAAELNASVNAERVFFQGCDLLDPTQIDTMVTDVLRRWRSIDVLINNCLLYTSPSPRDRQKSRMPSSA